MYGQMIGSNVCHNGRERPFFHRNELEGRKFYHNKIVLVYAVHLIEKWRPDISAEKDPLAGGF